MTPGPAEFFDLDRETEHALRDPRAGRVYCWGHGDQRWPLASVLAYSGRADLLARLIDAGLPVDLADALSTTQNEACIRILCSAGAVPSEHDVGLAIAQGRWDRVALFLERGVDPDIWPRGHVVESMGRLLHHAAARRGVGRVRMVLDHGATVDARNRMGMTPLHLALDQNDSQDARAVVRLLLDRGADFEAIDGFGESVRATASRRGRADWLDP